MASIVPATSQGFPGNKRRPVEIRISIVGGDSEVATPAMRAAFLTLAPTWRTLEGFSADEGFLDHLEGVIAGEQTTQDLAARYQRRGSYGWAVLRFVAEGAVQYAVDRQVRLGRDGGRTTLDSGIWSLIPTIAYGPRHRKRWRPPSWREDALEVLLARGGGRCLMRGCELAVQATSYCDAHIESSRNPKSVPQSNPKFSTAVHDTSIAAGAELLAELGQALGVPRHGLSF